MRMTTIAILVLTLGAAPASAQQVDPARTDAAIKAAFPTTPADFSPDVPADYNVVRDGVLPIRVIAPTPH